MGSPEWKPPDRISVIIRKSMKNLCVCLLKTVFSAERQKDTPERQPFQNRLCSHRISEL